MGGLAQLGNTLFLRFFFCLTWNWCSAQPIGEFGGITLALEQLEAEAPTEPPSL